jgi:hypothetical protein
MDKFLNGRKFVGILGTWMDFFMNFFLQDGSEERQSF